MQVPAVILAEIYSLLREHDEKPIMNEVMFIDGFKQGWIYIYGIQCKTMDFHCKTPLKCEVSFSIGLDKDKENIEKLARLSEALDKLINRYNRIMMFW